MADRSPVKHAVSLCPGRPNGRTFGIVEDAELDAGFIGRGSHGATQGIELLDQMTFADATDRRVATHLAKGLDIVSQQQGAATHPGCGQGGLSPGVTAADHDDVEFLRVLQWLHLGMSGVARRSCAAIKPCILPAGPGLGCALHDNSRCIVETIAQLVASRLPSAHRYPACRSSTVFPSRPEFAAFSLTSRIAASCSADPNGQLSAYR